MTDFIPTTEKIADADSPALPWGKIRSHLYRAAAKIKVREINGLAKDALEYYEHRNTGLSVIAIGGDKSPGV